MEEMNEKQSNIKEKIFAFGLVLTVVLFFMGFSKAVFIWPLLWIALGIDAYMIGYIAEFIAGLYTKGYLHGEVTTITVGILTLIPGGPGLYLYFCGEGWDGLASMVLLFFFALPLFITTIISLVMCIIRRRNSKKDNR